MCVTVVFPLLYFCHTHAQSSLRSTAAVVARSLLSSFSGSVSLPHSVSVFAKQDAIHLSGSGGHTHTCAKASPQTSTIKYSYKTG